MTSSNESLAEMTKGEQRMVSDAAQGNLISLKIGWNRPFGVFDIVPDGYAGAEAFAKAIDEADLAHA